MAIVTARRGDERLAVVGPVSTSSVSHGVWRRPTDVGGRAVGAQYPVHAELRGSFLLLFLRGGIIIIESAGLCSRMHAQFFHSSTGMITESREELQPLGGRPDPFDTGYPWPS